jgi:CDP-2,3-bis-(O-geranylgeranyl)-sn-glycerol synthase
MTTRGAFDRTKGLILLDHILVALWFFIPAGIANVTPIFLAKIPGLNRLKTPLDFGRTWRGKPIFGTNKTWRGLIGGVITATLCVWLQVWLSHHVGWIANLTASIDYADMNPLILGPLFAIGALGGDALESFFKRQRGIAPGRSWFPWDQTDYIIGASLTTFAFVSLSWYQYVLILLIWTMVHLVSSYIGFKLKLKERPI